MFNFVMGCCYHDELGINSMGNSIGEFMICDDEVINSNNSKLYILTDIMISFVDIIISAAYGFFILGFILNKLIFLLLDELTFDYFRFNERFNYRHSLRILIPLLYHQLPSFTNKNRNSYVDDSADVIELKV